MTTPICGKVLVGAGLVSTLVLLLFPLYPIAAISFEAGLVVGLFLHSTHTRSTLYLPAYLAKIDRKV